MGRAHMVFPNMDTGVPGDGAGQVLVGVEGEAVHGATVSDVLLEELRGFRVPHTCSSIYTEPKKWKIRLNGSVYTLYSIYIGKCPVI